MPNALSTQGVVAGYDRHHPVIHDLTVAVQASETLGLAGPSGSGKSTLARVLSLLHQPFTGTVSLDGRQVTRLPSPRPPRAAHPHRSRVPATAAVH